MEDIPSTSPQVPSWASHYHQVSYKKAIPMAATTSFCSTNDFKDLHNPYFSNYHYAFDDPILEQEVVTKRRIEKINNLSMCDVIAKIIELIISVHTRLSFLLFFNYYFFLLEPHFPIYRDRVFLDTRTFVCLNLFIRI